jgi:hypothetical protein
MVSKHKKLIKYAIDKLNLKDYITLKVKRLTYIILIQFNKLLI